MLLARRRALAVDQHTGAAGAPAADAVYRLASMSTNQTICPTDTPVIEIT
jgi:hypothetical protein